MAALDINPTVDLELQQALALSLQDINSNMAGDHFILQKPYPVDHSLAPICPCSASTVSRFEALDPEPASHGDEDDLARAIEMSLLDTKPTALSSKINQFTHPRMERRLDAGELMAQTFPLNLDRYKKPGTEPLEYTVCG